MTYFELTSVEKDYYDKLSVDEHRVYVANQEALATISTVNDFAVSSFVNASRLLNELHRTHHQYNEAADLMASIPNATDGQQTIFNRLYETNEETFSMTMAIGNFATVMHLACMDECDALYNYLAVVKMSRFDWLCDNFDVTVLTDMLLTNK